MSSTEAEAAERDYFSENPIPATLSNHSSLAKAFISTHAAANKRVVLITSGGTTVPLERQTVRFIDNFSAGTRGATSAEYFLEAGYAVIFLHRQFSLLPYSRHYSHSTDCFLDFLHEGDDGQVIANPEYKDKMLAVLQQYNDVKRRNMLLTLPFTTINDYLFVLRSISQLLHPLGHGALLYLAAAVSDFFVPAERMVEHKIQSTNAVEKKDDVEAFDNFDSDKAAKAKRFIIDLDPVPKFLKNLVDGWAPEGMIVSFKLETDPAILIHKAEYSLDRYQHHLVIGNLLSTRKHEVVFVSKEGERWIRIPKSQGMERHDANAVLPEPNVTETYDSIAEVEIESLIIPAVVEMHDKYIATASRT